MLHQDSSWNRYMKRQPCNTVHAIKGGHAGLGRAVLPFLSIDAGLACAIHNDIMVACRNQAAAAL